LQSERKYLRMESPVIRHLLPNIWREGFLARHIYTTHKNTVASAHWKILSAILNRVRGAVSRKSWQDEDMGR
jgi:hypothetical protein